MNKLKAKHHCWICEKNKGNVSKELHDYIMDQVKLKAKYSLAFGSLCKFLVGDEEHCRIYNTYRSCDYNGNPMNHALDILSKCGLKR